VIGVAVVTLVFYGSHRLRAPLEPVLIVAAAMFLAGLGPVRTSIDNRGVTPTVSRPADLVV
jgi:hypothetical protein